MSSAQGQTYYKKEYAQGDYYTRDANATRGEWSGQLASQLGLSGSIREDDFNAVLEGKSRAGQEQIIPDHDGKHRAGWDFVCSPDKSVSVMALVGGDTGIVDDVREANAAALRELEQYAMAKGADQQYRVAGNLAIASFVHDTSRKLDPQLHVHNVMMNMTRRDDGKIVALEPREMYRAQSYATAVFRAELAQRLQARGYEVEIGKDGNVSIKGVSRELCDEFSKRRRRDIEPYLAARGQEGAGAAQRAATSTRRAKQHDVDRGALQGAWNDVARERGADLNAIRTAAEERAPGVQPADSITRAEQAKASHHHAMEHLSERTAVFQGRELYVEALKHGMGKITIEDIRVAAMAERDLIVVEDKRIPSGQMTTRQALELERQNVALMREGMGAGEAILNADAVVESKDPSKPLSRGQLRVAEHILKNTDQVIAIEGKAGAGKTFTLESVVTAAQAAGWEVRGFAPYTGHAKELSKAGVEAKTIASLEHEEWNRAYGRQLWLVDEAGVMNSREAAIILKRARECGARVVFVGDRWQHHGVGAGSPFVYMQEAGLKAVRLDEIQRQSRHAKAIDKALEAAREGRWEQANRSLTGLAKRSESPIPELQQAADAIRDGRHAEALKIIESRSAQAWKLVNAVEQASDGNSEKAVNQLDQAGKIIETKNEAERYRVIVQDYRSTPQGQSCLVIAPSNKERKHLNELIRDELVKAGIVSTEGFDAQVRVSKSLTNAEKKDIRNFEAGDHVRFQKASKKFGIERGTEGRVIGVNREKNLVRVQLENGKVRDFNPARFRAEVAKVTTRRVAVGDRIQYREATKPDGKRLKGDGFKIANGEIGTIRHIDHASGRAVVELESSKRKTLELDLHKCQPIDHAYSLTSHAGQSRTVDRSLVLIDTTQPAALVNKKMLYTASSRAALETKIHTNSKADLVQAVSRDADKSSSMELLGRKKEKIQEVKNALRPEPRREPTRETGQQQAAQQLDRNHERDNNGRRGPTAAPAPASRRADLSLDTGPDVRGIRAVRDLAARSAAQSRHGIVNITTAQSHDRTQAIRGNLSADEQREARTDQNAGRVKQSEAGTGRPLAEALNRDNERLERGDQAREPGHRERSASPGEPTLRIRRDLRDRAEIRDTDRGGNAAHGAEINRNRSGPTPNAGPDNRPREMGTPDSRTPVMPGHHAPVQMSDWDRLNQQAQALKDGLTAPMTHGSTIESDAARHRAQTTEAPAWSRVAHARAQTLEQQLLAAEKQFNSISPSDWKKRQAAASPLESLQVQAYEARQDARTDIDQIKHQALKQEVAQLAAADKQATNWQQREPIEKRRIEVREELYKLRHGPRTELGHLGGKQQLGIDEYKLHDAHKALNEAAKRYPAFESPATREAVQYMSKEQLQDFSRAMQDAASKAHTAIVTAKEGKLDQKTEAQAIKAIDKVRERSRTAARNVDINRDQDISIG